LDEPRFSEIVDGFGGVSKSDQLDEQLFQTARAINTSTYVYLIVHDYLRALIGLSRTNSTWVLDPAKEYQVVIQDIKGTLCDPTKGVPGTHTIPGRLEEVPRATGNQSSIEFNLIYRWHSTISENDAKWLEQVLRQLVGPDFTDPAKVIQKLNELSTRKTTTKPYERIYFYGEERRKSSSPDCEVLPFDDDILAKHLLDSIKAPAGGFGTPNIPEVMAAIEILGIEQGRKLGVCTFNEYRKFLHLRQFKDFKDINPNPKVCEALKELYHTVDDVELYPGLVAEEEVRDPRTPGTGLAPGYTIVTAILSDAIALVRGDRFLTIEDTPKSLTQWGFEESRSKEAPGVIPEHYGTLIGEKLIHRHLPIFPSNYVGTVFPFNTPAENQLSLPEADKHKYTFEDPFAISPPFNPHH